MGTGLSVYARRFLEDEKAVRLEQLGPVLIWEAPVQEIKSQELVWGTNSGGIIGRPRRGEPLVLPVVKTLIKVNAFAMGITVGRTENNDVTLEDNSVSRFHAYFQHKPHSSEWKLVDAESKNGSWAQGVRLIHNKGVTLSPKSLLQFGDVEVLFLMPEAFFDYLREKVKE